MATNTLYQQQVKALRDQVKTTRERLVRFKANRRRVTLIGEVVKRLAKDNWDIRHHEFVTDSGGLKMWLWVDNLDGFGDSILIKILERMDRHGINFHKSTDQPDQSQRTYYGHTDDEVISIDLMANLKTDAAKCKRVVVGFKQSEPEPIYKFECQ